MSAVRELRSIGALPRRATRRPFGLSASEMIAVLLTLAFFIIALVYSMKTLGPYQSRGRELESKLASLETELIKLRSKEKEEPPKDTTQEALDSLDRFKSKYLKSISQGEIALYRDINALTRKHNVTLASGIDMERDIVKEGNDKKGEKKGSKSKNDPIGTVYPRTVVRFTVAGQYNELRTFLNELEHNQQFIIINTISLNEAEQEEGGGGRRGRTSGPSGIALSIEMSAYFHP